MLYTEHPLQLSQCNVIRYNGSGMQLEVRSKEFVQNIGGEVPQKMFAWKFKMKTVSGH